VVNLSWQGDYWQNAPTKEEQRRAGHRYVQHNLPYERWNFNFNIHVADGFKVGFFQATVTPKDFASGQGIVFFYSKKSSSWDFTAKPNLIPSARLLRKASSMATFARRAPCA
jgi:hypothetical protein